MDGKTENITEHFADIYKNLYNSVDDGDEIEILKDEVNLLININNLEDVDKVTPTIVKSATKNLKTGKLILHVISVQIAS